MPGRRHSGTPRSEYLTTKAVQTRPSTRLFTRMDTASSGHAGNGFGTNTATTSANHVKPRMMCPSTWPPIVQHVAAQQTERRTLSIKYANGDPAAALIKLWAICQSSLRTLHNCYQKTFFFGQSIHSIYFVSDKRFNKTNQMQGEREPMVLRIMQHASRSKGLTHDVQFHTLPLISPSPLCVRLASPGGTWWTTNNQQWVFTILYYSQVLQV
jgi:hypothetical protein